MRWVASGWVAEIVVDQLAAWNKWWVDTRFRTETVTAAATEATNIGMYAPGSTREVMHHPLMCVFQKPVSASKCETGLDNSPLYDTAVFVPATDTLDQTDVGMTALANALGSSSGALDRKTQTTSHTQQHRDARAGAQSKLP